MKTAKKLFLPCAALVMLFSVACGGTEATEDIASLEAVPGVEETVAGGEAVEALASDRVSTADECGGYPPCRTEWKCAPGTCGMNGFKRTCWASPYYCSPWQQTNICC